MPAIDTDAMTYARFGTLRAQPGQGDRIVDILIRPNSETQQVGCLMYEVGRDGEDPDLVHVVELWESSDAHRASLQLESVRSAIAEAMPLLTPDLSGTGFEIDGSPLRSV